MRSDKFFWTKNAYSEDVKHGALAACALRGVRGSRALTGWQLTEQTPRDTGKWLPNDEIPNSLIPILQWQFQDQISYVHEVMSMTSQWLAEHPDTSDFPRFIGKAPYKIDGACGQRMCAPYTQWMYQRVTGPIEQVTASENAALTQWLAQH